LIRLLRSNQFCHRAILHGSFGLFGQKAQQQESTGKARVKVLSSSQKGVAG
jgi:hypothetical protein